MKAISELLFASVSKEVITQNLLCQNAEHIFIRMVLHQMKKGNLELAWL